jgi:hypothetical protein
VARAADPDRIEKGEQPEKRRKKRLGPTGRSALGVLGHLHDVVMRDVLAVAVLHMPLGQGHKFALVLAHHREAVITRDIPLSTTHVLASRPKAVRTVERDSGS